MSINVVKDLVGKKVQIYPGDTYSKFGIILDINDAGMLFKITDAERESGYKKDEIRFISYSARLNVKVVEGV